MGFRRKENEGREYDRIIYVLVFVVGRTDKMEMPLQESMIIKTNTHFFHRIYNLLWSLHELDTAESGYQAKEKESSYYYCRSTSASHRNLSLSCTTVLEDLCKEPNKMR